MDDRTHLLEYGNVSKLLFSFAMPAIIATAASSLYNLIDRMFIGQGVGSLALAGLGLTLPVMNVATGFGTLVGAGAGALVAIRMGEKKKDSATKILCNALLLNLIISIVFSIATLVFLDEILYLFGADQETLPYARDFLQIILAGNVITHLLFGLNSIMRSSGYPVKAMLSVLITVVCNLILAPLFIFGFRWGIRGAATATVISQFIGMCWVMAHFLNPRSFIHFERKSMRLDVRLALEIFSIGLSPFFIHTCSSLVNIFMNWQLKEYGGNMAIAAFGIVSVILSLLITIILGMTHGMQPIVGFNYGAGKSSRVLQTYWLTVRYATLVCAIGFVALMFVPQYIARAFTDSPEVVKLTARAMRICGAMMLLIGFQVVTSNFFQSIGKAKISVFLSLSRQIIFLLPFILLLPNWGGLDGVWGAMPAADLCSTGITALMLWLFLKKWKKEGALN
ncbi:MAG: MATE family efflux transporter [Bacteroidales bacterium]|nr:MATE family efflux transporter [Bacteroidales bacterium]